MALAIEPLKTCHFVGPRKALDVVAREKRFLAFTEALPLEAALAFYAFILSNEWWLLVATLDDAVVKWCERDVPPNACRQDNVP